MLIGSVTRFGRYLRASMVACLVPLSSLTSGVAADAECHRPGSEHRHVVRVIDGETLLLDDGRQVRLAGALAPNVLDITTEVGSWPPADAARAALAGVVEGKAVALAAAGGGPDRHKRISAHVHVRDTAVWVQGWMLRQGHARAYALDPSEPCLAELLAAESEARTSRRGVWGHAAYQILAAATPAALERARNTFQIVEGTARKPRRSGGRLYINFRPYRRRGFAVSLPESIERREGRVLSVLAGKRLRVRGWITGRTGPLIEILHPALIEIVGEEVSGSPVKPARGPQTIDVKGSD